MTKMQILGQAVIVQAVKDLKSRNKHPKYNYAEQANKFLSIKNKGFLYWCGILNVNPEWLLDKIKKECADDYERISKSVPRT